VPDLVLAVALDRLSYWEGVLEDARRCNDNRHVREATHCIEEYAHIIAGMLAEQQATYRG
jgi:hypothetical protein